MCINHGGHRVQVWGASVAAWLHVTKRGRDEGPSRNQTQPFNRPSGATDPTNQGESGPNLEPPHDSCSFDVGEEFRGHVRNCESTPTGKRAPHPVDEPSKGVLANNVMGRVKDQQGEDPPKS